MKLSIVVPCYNESKNIPLILNRFNEVIKRSDIQVVLVDNGSYDGTDEVLKTLLLDYPFVKQVRVQINQGYGYGIISGLKQSDGEYVGWMHGDMQTDPKDAIRALEIIERKGNPTNIFIKGNRKGRSIFDNAFTLGMSVFETLLLNKVLWEINAQPNIFHRTFLEKWINPPFDFSLDLYAYYLAKKMELNIVRLEVVFPKRIHGTSTWNTGLAERKKFIERTIKFSINLRRNL